MRSALGPVAGVGAIDIKAGDPDFTVHFDSKKVSQAAIVAALKAGGEPGARVKS